MPMKIAKSKDPVQQKLRDKKRSFNTAAREFISRLIALKSTLNGKGANRYGLPPSDIKMPLPNEFGSFMHEVESNFSQLMNEANQIEAEQATYSAARQQKLQERPEVKPASHQSSLIKKASLFHYDEAVVLLGYNKFPTLLAKTPEEQSRGLMHIKPPTPVMSFVYAYPQLNKFWMKNTPSPLDIVFSLGGKITAIHKGVPHSTMTIGGEMPSDLVVELPEGTCKQLGITPGDTIRLSK
jgi:uncharacterized membrane protein (UPF0127 family)